MVFRFYSLIFFLLQTGILQVPYSFIFSNLLYQFFLDLIIKNAIPATIMYPNNEITDDSIPNSPPVMAKSFELSTYVVTEYLSIFSPMANPPPIITTFQIA